MTAHLFDVDEAVLFGVNAAVLLQYIRHWVEKNERNGRHYYEGEYWTYNSVKAFGELFPYMTAKQIRTALSLLEDEGIIKSASFNHAGYDRTKWYTICPQGQIHLPSRANPFALQGKPIPEVNTYDIHTNEYQLKEKSSEKTKAGRRRGTPFVPDFESIGVTGKSRELVERWLDYKKSKGQTYKNDQSIKVFVNKLREYSFGDLKTATSIVEHAIANNYAGIFPPKQAANGKRTQTTDEDLAKIIIAKRERDRSETSED